MRVAAGGGLEAAECAMVFVGRGGSSDQQQGGGGQDQNQSGDSVSRAEHGGTYVGSQRGMSVELFMDIFSGLGDWGFGSCFIRGAVKGLSYRTAPINVVQSQQWLFISARRLAS
jgi:hypothetical protein